MRPLLSLLGLAASLTVAVAGDARGEPVLLDRVVVRFYAPETGGVERPRFIYERRLAFEARIEALADQDRGGEQAYRERHVSAALERHVSEGVLSSLRIDPEPLPAVMDHQVELARRLLSDRVGGEEALLAAQRAEGIGQAELTSLLR